MKEEQPRSNFVTMSMDRVHDSIIAHAIYVLTHEDTQWRCVEELDYVMVYEGRLGSCVWFVSRAKTGAHAEATFRWHRLDVEISDDDMARWAASIASEGGWKPPPVGGELDDP